MTQVKYLRRMKEPAHRKLASEVHSLLSDLLPERTDFTVTRENHLRISIPNAPLTVAHLALVLHPDDFEVEVGIHFEKQGNRKTNREDLALVRGRLKSDVLSLGRRLEFLGEWRDNPSQGWTKAFVRIPGNTENLKREAVDYLIILHAIAAPLFQG